jgi:alpha-galactosidase
MITFVKDVRKEYEVPKLPFVIGVMGAGGPVDNYGPTQQRYKSTHDNFRKAMAAPAAIPEFKGNVTAVRTENYWDAELDELKARGGKVKAKAQELSKDKNLSRKQRDDALAKFRAELYTPRELEILKGSSNAGFHYNGCGKIMAQIGKGFAEAMAKMTESRK